MWRSALRAACAVILPLITMAMTVCAVLPACPMMTGPMMTAPMLTDSSQEASAESKAGHCHQAMPDSDETQQETPRLRCCCQQPLVTAAIAIEVPIQLDLAAVSTRSTPEAVLAGFPVAGPDIPPRPGPRAPLFELHESLLL